MDMLEDSKKSDFHSQPNLGPLS